MKASHDLSIRDCDLMQNTRCFCNSIALATVAAEGVVSLGFERSLAFSRRPDVSAWAMGWEEGDTDLGFVGRLALFPRAAFVDGPMGSAAGARALGFVIFLARRLRVAVSGFPIGWGGGEFIMVSVRDLAPSPRATIAGRPISFGSCGTGFLLCCTFHYVLSLLRLDPFAYLVARWQIVGQHLDEADIYPCFACP